MRINIEPDFSPLHLHFERINFPPNILAPAADTLQKYDPTAGYLPYNTLRTETST